MIAHRQMLPVGHQRIIRPSEHDAYIGGMLEAAVEVGVIWHMYRHVHGHLRMVMERFCRFNKRLPAGIAEYLHQFHAYLAHLFSAQREQGIQRVLPEVFDGHTFDDMPF